MGNICKTSSLTQNTEVSDDFADHQAIMSTNNRAIFNPVYKQEQVESTFKLPPQPLVSQLPFPSLDLIEPNQYIPQIKANRRTMSFAKENSLKDDNRSRTTTQKVKSENIQKSKQPIKPSLKSLKSKQGSSHQSHKSVRWGSDQTLLTNLIHYQNQMI